MNDIDKEVMEVDIELAQALRFSVSDTRDDIEPLATIWHDLIADVINFDQTLILAGDIRPVVVKGLVSFGSKKINLNSPLVAVIEDITPSGDEAGLYRCALVYQGGGRVIAGPGDIIATSGDSQVMIEAWNMFTLQEKDLGPATFFQLSQKTVEAVKIYAAFQPQPEDGGRYPLLDLPEEVWNFPLMCKDDPRIKFRLAEIEVGFILSMRGIRTLPEVKPVERPNDL